MRSGVYYKGQLIDSIADRLTPKKPVLTSTLGSSGNNVGGTALGKRLKKEAAELHQCQPLNRGVRERAAAILRAKKKGNRLKSWVRYSENGADDCVVYPWKTTHIADEDGFGIAVQLHFSLMRWFASLAFIQSAMSIYLTYLTWTAYENDLTVTADMSAFMPLSVLSFADSDKIPDEYHWVLCAQVCVTIFYMLALRLMIYRKKKKFEMEATTAADFTVLVKDLPGRSLVNDQLQRQHEHMLKERQSKKESDAIHKQSKYNTTTTTTTTTKRTRAGRSTGRATTTTTITTSRRTASPEAAQSPTRRERKRGKRILFRALLHRTSTSTSRPSALSFTSQFRSTSTSSGPFWRRRTGSWRSSRSSTKRRLSATARVGS